MGRFDEAKDVYAKLLAKSPDSPEALVNLADVFAMTQGGSLMGRPVELINKALSIDPHDGDVLIAAYQFKKTDESWKEKTLKLIAASAAFYAQEVDTLEKKIRTTLDRTAKQQLEYELARACNQYAWVVSNTVGDYKQAVKFSERSLDLRGWELAGYLDTLSHTYFAVKDYENAVKYQTKAVKLDPASQLMRKKLKIFQTALDQSKTES